MCCELNQKKNNNGYVLSSNVYDYLYINMNDNMPTLWLDRSLNITQTAAYIVAEGRCFVEYVNGR